MANARSRKDAEVVLLKEDEMDKWQEHSGNVYRCAVHLIPEQGGGFSAVAPLLSGAASQGETEAEALTKITEALAAVIATYRGEGQPIPWKDHLPEPESGVLTRWVFVHV